MKRLLALLAALTLVAAACGSDDDSADTTPPTTPTTTVAPTTTDPEGPNRLILQVTDEGGFAPIEFILNRLPRFSLYADGTLLSPGVSIAIFPGPILGPVQQVTLTQDQMEDVMTLIDAIGLPGIDEEIDTSLNNRVADATTTIATYFDDAGEHTYGVYALGLALDEPQPDAALNLGALVNLLDSYVAEGNDGGLYEPDRIQMFLNETPFVDPDFSETLPWPLEITPDDFEVVADFNRRCQVLDGDAAAVAIAAFAAGNQTTIWEYEGAEFQLIARPLLPGEPGCLR